MKKILFALVAVAFVATLCFAQKGQTASGSLAPSNRAAVPLVAKTFVGKVESVSWGGGHKGAKPGIMAIDDKGQQMDFVAKSNATITGKNGKPIDMTDIKKGDKISVSYVTRSDGVNRAKSIKLE